MRSKLEKTNVRS